MSSTLLRWDVAWREATVNVGHVEIPQEPDDDAAVAALAERATDVEARSLASWAFGQAASEALAGLKRMRSLYESLDDAAWRAAVEAFRLWVAGSGIAPDTRLGGQVELVVVSGTVA